MRNLKRISVLWLSTCQERPVGLVKAFDPVTGNRPAAGSWTYYAGIGRGWDEAVQLFLKRIEAMRGGEDMP